MGDGYNFRWAISIIFVRLWPSHGYFCAVFDNYGGKRIDFIENCDNAAKLDKLDGNVSC